MKSYKELRNPVVIIAIITGVFYVFGRQYYILSLQYWGVSYKLFPLNFYETLTHGFHFSLLWTLWGLWFIALIAWALLIFSGVGKTLEKSIFLWVKEKWKSRKRRLYVPGQDDDKKAILLIEEYSVKAIIKLLFIMISLLSIPVTYEFASYLSVDHEKGKHANFKNYPPPLEGFSEAAKIVFADGTSCDPGFVIASNAHLSAIYCKQDDKVYAKTIAEIIISPAIPEP